MPLNRNNILRFNGTFIKRLYEFRYDNYFFVFFYANEDYIFCNPLQGTDTSSTFPIDSNSMEVTAIQNTSGINKTLQSPIEYNGVILKIYRPVDLTLTTLRIFIRYKDVLGNKSGNYFFDVSISPVYTTWVQYPPSAQCVLDNLGQNNGSLEWLQLKKINASTLSDILPLTLKDNAVSDPDYVPPVTDLITCPVSTGGVYSSIIIGNFSRLAANGLSNYIVIDKITLSGTFAGSPVFIEQDCNIQPDKTQRFNVPAISYAAGLTIYYTVFGDMDTVPFERYWRSQSSGVSAFFPSGSTNQVDNTGIYGNFAITVPATNGITIFCQ